MYRKFSSGSKENYRFSIIIPTWNNLDYLKLCVRSIKENSAFLHQIILHVNEGTDGSLEWAEESGLDYVYTAENVGICYALNICRSLVETDYILYMNDDMYVCPDWDKVLSEGVDNSEDNLFFFSSTMIEPEDTGNRCVIVQDYGSSVENFNEEKLLDEFKSFKKYDWNGATWPPNLIHRDLWDLVGGYSVEFSPGMYSDPDFSQKLWTLGIRRFQGFGQSRVYHFGGKSTSKLRKSRGKKVFKKKWGISSGIFVKYFLKRGSFYRGPLTKPENSFRFIWSTFLDKLR